MVLNLSEIESKVREATNDDPWYTVALSHLLEPGTDALHAPSHVGARARR